MKLNAKGNGSEKQPYRSQDGTAGIADALSSLSERGGLLTLKCGRYDVSSSIVLDTPSTSLTGEVWACNTDPNGVFETPFGTKIRMTKRFFRNQDRKNFRSYKWR